MRRQHVRVRIVCGKYALPQGHNTRELTVYSSCTCTLWLSCLIVHIVVKRGTITKHNAQAFGQTSNDVLSHVMSQSQ
jgi:hypothetical protein